MNDRVFHASQAHKLDDPQRKTWLPPGEVIEALGLAPGMVIADIGAGTGYFSFALLRSDVQPSRIYAVDLQREMLDLLQSRASEDDRSRLLLLQGSAAATNIPNASCDLVLLANVWHELDERHNVLKECRRILKPGATLAILDWRSDVSPTPGPPLAHRIPSSMVVSELAEDQWCVRSELNIGTFSYLVLATRAASHSDSGSTAEIHS